MTPGADGASRDGSHALRAGERLGWVLLVYRIPSEPTRLRAGVWRKLKGHGAIYLQNSVAVLPDVGSHERTMRGLRAEIVGMGGSAQVLRIEAIVGGADIVAIYNSARDDEYDELVDKCRDFLDELATETAASHFTYGELEENEEDLAKLRHWMGKIADRDVLAAPGSAAARAALAECQSGLEDFAHRVYGADPDAG